MTRKEIKRILVNAGFEEKIIEEAIPEIQKMLKNFQKRENLAKTIQKAIDEDICCNSSILEWRINEVMKSLKDHQSNIGYTLALKEIFFNMGREAYVLPNIELVVKQLRGELTGNPPKLKLPTDVYHVELKKEVIEFWIRTSEKLLNEKSYKTEKYIKLFINAMKETLESNIHSFDVTLDCVGINEWNMLCFGDDEECREKLHHIWHKGSGGNDIEVYVKKTSGIELGTIDHFVLYVVSQMNDLAKNIGNAKLAFESFIETDEVHSTDDILCSNNAFVLSCDGPENGTLVVGLPFFEETINCYQRACNMDPFCIIEGK